MAKLNIGDKVKHIKFGFGIIKKIDETSPEFYYYADFTGKGGDGTKAWLPRAIQSKVLQKII